MKKPKRIYEAVTEEEFIKLVKATRSTKQKIAFILAYGSGLRVSEIVNLKREDIDLDSKKIMIRQAKGAKDRIVNTPKWLKKSHLTHFPLDISTRAISKGFETNSYRAGINRLLYETAKGESNVKRHRLHFHCLRHSFATRALDKGVPIHHLQLLLGHENLSTTSRYTKANPTDAIRSIVDLEV
jgi:integrase/recombinase XerD